MQACKYVYMWGGGMYIDAFICEHMQSCIYICACMLCVPVCVLRKGVKMGGEAGGPELEHRECGCSGRADKSRVHWRLKAAREAEQSSLEKP